MGSFGGGGRGRAGTSVWRAKIAYLGNFCCIIIIEKMQEGSLFTPDEAKQVRRAVALLGTKALQVLKKELEKQHRGGRISEAWTKKYKTLADQIRRDYRLDGEVQPQEETTEPPDPLDGLRLVNEDEEAA